LSFTLSSLDAPIGANASGLRQAASSWLPEYDYRSQAKVTKFDRAVR